MNEWIVLAVLALVVTDSSVFYQLNHWLNFQSLCERALKHCNALYEDPGMTEANKRIKITTES